MINTAVHSFTSQIQATAKKSFRSSNMKTVFQYLQLPNGMAGRGGVQRFFMLTNDIPFEEKLYSLSDEWPELKKQMIESGENPCGALPVTNIEGLPCSQHIATCRYLARLHNKSSGEAQKDFIQDLVADEHHGFRDAWAAGTFGDDAAKAEYKEKLPGILAKFDALYKKFKTGDVYLSTSSDTNKPLWGDAAIYTTIYDNIVTGHMTKEELVPYKHLYTLFEAYGAIPCVAAWVDAQK